MKGIIFREFSDLVEEKFGLEMLDRIISASDLASKGAYTRVGTYDHHEIVQLATQLSKETAIPLGDLYKVFGEHLFPKLAEGYSELVGPVATFEGILIRLNGIIHVAVRRIYPDAELPRIRVIPKAEGFLDIEYESTRPFADVAEGLLRGCAAYCRQQIELQREDLSDPPGCHARFLVRTDKEVLA